MRSIAIPLLFCVVIAAPPPPIPLIGEIHAAPPEFAADALLRTAENAKLAPAVRIEVIEEAFRLAQSARFPMSYRPVRNERDSHAAVLNQAYRMHLDALNLETRAVHDLLPLAPAKARQLFEEVRLPQLPESTCADALIPDVSSFYPVLGEVLQSTFSPQERAKEEHVNFLLGYLSRTTSPVQLAPMARLLPTLTLTPEQKDVVFVQFNGILASMPAPDRVFAATLSDIEAALTGEMQPAFAEYQRRARATNLPCHDSDIQANPFWQSGDSQAIFEQVRNRVPDLLQQVSSWGGGFEEKSLLYTALLDSATGPEFDKTLVSFIEFLNSSSLAQQSPVEWFMPAKFIFERFHDSNSSQAARVVSAYRESGSPVLVLYAALEQMYGSKRPSWIAAGAP